MPRLIDRIIDRIIDRTRRHGDDRGAVTTVVAIVLGVGLLLGIGALVIDTGQLYVERAELQNGADAAALAVAQDCADADGCAPDAQQVAERYAADNDASDGKADASLVCGRTTTGFLAPCPAEDAVSDACLGTRPPAPGNFVEVRTTTLQDDDSTVLPPVFGQILLGDDYDGRGVLACARAAWGGLRAASTLPLTISFCEWQYATQDGVSFAPAPPTVVDGSYERVLSIKADGGDPIPCPGTPSGGDLPGGFGWLADSDCGLDVDVDGSFSADPGVSGAKCEALLSAARTSGEPLLVPIFDVATGTGSNGTYQMRGFAAFVVTGYDLAGFKAASTLTGRRKCSATGSSSAKCVFGYFTKDLVTTAGTVLGGPDMGATTVQVIG
ncbi:pilus assembly protein TadG-related protein [Nocardioides sp. NPDC057767]|uniref:pilus assembly protein TadG-related protein n=1 Tax=unclassified Nocardioides TaxID=2615069 RepID=UPI0036708A15